MTTFTDTALTSLQLLTQFDPLLWSIVGRSLWVSVLATVLACSLGLVLGAWLGVSRFAGRDALLTVLNTLLALPSVVVGLLIYLLLSRTGPLGHLGWLFSLKAMVLAVIDEAPGVKTFVLRPNQPWRGMKAGQFVQLDVEIEMVEVAGSGHGVILSKRT